MSQQQGASPRLLIVDDNEANRYTKARTLRHAGFTITEVATGADALRLVRREPPSLVVLDVNLPDINGWDVCQRIKSDPATATLPVLQMSASFVTDADTVRALEGGADACLTEPVEPPVLIATVRALLRARRAEEALRASLAGERTARAAAESASRAKDEFLATLSHELRSPLNAILTWVTLARSGQLGPDRSAQALEVIERNTRLQARMIEDLLDVSRIVSGKMQLSTAVADLAPIALAALESVQPQAEHRQVRLVAQVAPDAGPVLADAGRMQQVFTNLLSNAVKFTGPGGSVELSVRNEGDAVLAAVTDSGRGIAPEFLPHIFERFRQADASTTRNGGGLGIGLAIVRHLVELHGGSIEAESDGLGMGACFRVRLARATSTSARREPTQLDARSGDRLVHDLHGAAVLLVDDETDARTAVSMLLSGAGARVIEASSAPAALQAIAHEVPDLVISDIAMPGEDGYSLIRSLRASPSERIRALPVIALTAYNHADDRLRIAEAGFALQLSKPTDVERLTAAVARITARRS
jgi:signal transduction histidine kinase